MWGHVTGALNHTSLLNFAHFLITLNNMVIYIYNNWRLQLFLCHSLLTNLSAKNIEFIEMDQIVTNKCKKNDMPF